MARRIHRHDPCVDTAVIDPESCQGRVSRWLHGFLADEEAVAMAEYAYLLGIIALGALAGLTLLSDGLIQFFSSTGDQLGEMVD